MNTKPMGLASNKCRACLGGARLGGARLGGARLGLAHLYMSIALLLTAVFLANCQQIQQCVIDGTLRQCWNYVCTNGQAGPGQIDVKNTQQCVSCNSTYRLENDTCINRTEYTCGNGTPHSGMPAGNSNKEMCVSCENGFFLNSQGVCANNNTFLVNLQTINDSSTENLDSPIALATATISGTTYLYVAGNIDNGVSVFSLHSTTGYLTHVQSIDDNATYNLGGASAVATATVSGTTYLYVAGNTDHGLSVFSVARDTGYLTHVQSIDDNDSHHLNTPSAITTATFSSGTYLYVAGYSDNGVSSFLIDDDGTLSNVENIGSTTNNKLDGASSLATITLGANTYLYVAGALDNGLSVFSVNASNGTLSPEQDIGDDNGLNLNGARSLAFATLGDTTYLYVVGTDDNGISAFSINNTDGHLANVQNVTNSSNLTLNRPVNLTIATSGSTTYLYSVAEFSNGVAVFRLNNSNGNLMHVQNIDSSAVPALASPTAVATATFEASTYLYVAANENDAVSVFSAGK